MSQPFLGEISIFSFDFAPRGWAQCNGQLLAINQNQALFSLLGTTYGGNGIITFGLPDLRGRTAIHVSNSFLQGQMSGNYAHTLTSAELPMHSHNVRVSSKHANLLNPNNAILAQSSQPAFSNASPGAVYETATPMLTSISISGGGQSHTNMQPYLGVNICIALQGIFPSRN